jgi:hypothetical protein
MRGNKSLLKNHMMPIAPDKPPEKPRPEPIAPPPSAERPPVTDASTDEGNGSPSPKPEGAMENDTLILIGLGALLLFSYGMVK